MGEKNVVKFKGCGKCGDDLTLSYDEWGCFQCGNRYDPKISTLDLQLEPVEIRRPVTAGSSASELKPPTIRRSARHLNPVLADTKSNEERWWEKTSR